MIVLTAPFTYGLSQESSEKEKPEKEPLSEWSKQWLEEVVPYIITSEEKKAFTNLPNEAERGKFIKRFWRIRDPNPATLENEYKIEYYKRIAFANKFLGTSIPGWRTDRGRIYILLGPPSDIQQDFSPSTSLSPLHQAAREIWTYMGLPGKKLPYSLDLVFVDKFGTGDYVLQGNTGFGDLSSMHFHFDYMENLTEVLKTPYESLKELQGVITTQVTYDLIPMKNNLFYLKGSEQNTYIPLIVEVPYANLPFKKIEDRYHFSLTLIINISNKLGQVVHQRSKEIRFNHSQAMQDSMTDKALQIQTFLLLEPEAYKIHLLISDNFGGKIGTLHQEITVPAFGNVELSLSDIIFSHKPYEADYKQSGSKRAAIEQVFSGITESFYTNQELHIYFEIYNLAVGLENGVNDFSIEYLFLRNGELISHVPSAKPKSTTQKDCLIQTSFRLKNYKPGEYTLQIKVSDAISGKSAIKYTHFLITDSLSSAENN